MKHLVLLIVLQFLFLSCKTLQAQWVQTNGPSEGAIYCFYPSGSNLFAATRGGLYLSTNNGTSWTVVHNGIPASCGVFALSGSGAYLFASTFGNNDNSENG